MRIFALIFVLLMSSTAMSYDHSNYDAYSTSHQKHQKQIINTMFEEWKVWYKLKHIQAAENKGSPYNEGDEFHLWFPGNTQYKKQNFIDSPHNWDQSKAEVRTDPIFLSWKYLATKKKELTEFGRWWDGPLPIGKFDRALYKREDFSNIYQYSPYIQEEIMSEKLRIGSGSMYACINLNDINKWISEKLNEDKLKQLSEEPNPEEAMVHKVVSKGRAINKNGKVDSMFSLEKCFWFQFIFPMALAMAMGFLTKFNSFAMLAGWLFAAWLVGFWWALASIIVFGMFIYYILYSGVSGLVIILGFFSGLGLGGRK